MAYPLLRIKKLFLFFCGPLLLLALPCYAQNSQIASLEIKLKQNLPDTTRLRVLRELNLAYTAVDASKKLYYARQGEALAIKLKDEKGQAEAMVNMGVAYGIQGKTDSAINEFKQAYNLSEQNNFEMGMARSLGCLGYVYDRNDNSSESIKCYFKALAIFKKLKYQKGINQCTINIGSIYFDLHQNKLAESYFIQCYNIARAAKDEAGIAYARFVLANCYKEMGRYDEALDFYNQSMETRKKLADSNGVALVYKGLGMMYRYQKKYDEGLAASKTALRMVTALQDRYEQEAVLQDLAELYLAKGDFNNAIASSNESLTIAKSIKAGQGIIGALSNLVKAYKGKGEINAAFKYQSQYVEAVDSTLVQKSLRDVTLVEFDRVRTENVELAKTNQEIISQNSNNQQRITQYSNVIVTITVILVLLILLALIQYRRNLEKQEANRKLQNQKEEINVINQELAALNEEVTTQMEIAHTQNIELERLNEIKIKLFSIISHDIRGPLGTLKALFSIYRDGDLDEIEFGELLVKLEDTIISTGSFLDNLLEWSKGQLDGFVVNAANFDVNRQIESTIQLLSAKIGLKKLNVRNLTQGAVIAYADGNMINLVLSNLLSNSVKFCNPGDEINLNAVTEGDKVLISVQDTGPGISLKDKEKLFNLEFAVSAGTQGEKGSHLGLILCRDMVQQNGGRLWFDSEEDRGTTFWVELPLGK